MRKPSMLTKVIIATLLAIPAGLFLGKTSPYYDIFDLIGMLFLNSLTLLIVPLVTSSIISGLGQMSGMKSFARLGGKTFGMFLFAITLATLLGTILVNTIKPGLLHRELLSKELLQTPVVSHNGAFTQVVLKIIPPNIFAAATEGNLLGLIFFSILFGLALIKVDNEFGKTVAKFSRGVFEVTMQITKFIMKVIPIGVFCLIAKVIANSGIHAISGLVYYFITASLGLIIYTFGVIPLIMKLSGVSPIEHFKAMSSALITAFTTSSSAASIPVSMECTEKNAGVSHKVCSFVIPLGSTMSMTGSAIYACIASFFIAQLYGIEMTFSNQFLITLLSIITSVGVAGVPSGSLVGILIVLSALGIPGGALAFILPLDRVLDMMRSVTNIFTGASCAVLIAKNEGEKVYQCIKQ